MKFTGKHFLLMMLYAPNDYEVYNSPIAGRTRLMKMGFLFEKELLKDFKLDRNFVDFELPEYFAWKYGPFSSQLLNDLEFLINREFISSYRGDNPPTEEEFEEFRYWIEEFDILSVEEFEEEIFGLTISKGFGKAEDLWHILSQNQRELITRFKNQLTKAPLKRILEYVYRKYSKSGFTDKSLIRDQYLSL